MRKLLMIPVLLGLCLTGCMNYITQVHTDGTASDVVDETQTPTTNASASIPVSVIPESPIPASVIPKGK